MKSNESTARRRIVGRFERGDALPQAVTELCKKHDILAGEFRALGAVTDLKVTEYDIESEQYRPPIGREKACEILMLYGNISYKDGELFAHLHITASYFEKGQTQIIAGHLVEAKVFACEFVIEAFDDLELVRVQDDPTGLMLWGDVSKK